MLARCLSGSLHGIEALAVTVEVDLVPGLPGLQLVGLPDAAIQESRERVRSALPQQWLSRATRASRGEPGSCRSS